MAEITVHRGAQFGANLAALHSFSTAATFVDVTMLGIISTNNRVIGDVARSRSRSMNSINGEVNSRAGTAQISHNGELIRMPNPANVQPKSQKWVFCFLLQLGDREEFKNGVWNSIWEPGWPVYLARMELRFLEFKNCFQLRIARLRLGLANSGKLRGSFMVGDMELNL